MILREQIFADTPLPFLLMIAIRGAQLADAPALARCHIAAWRDSYRPLAADAILRQPSLGEEYVRKWTDRIRDPGNLIFVAQSGPADLVGFLQGGRERTGRTDYPGEIYLVYLLKEYRGQGIGRKLFGRFAGALLENQIASAIVWVFEENPCRHSYAAWGGQQVEAGTVKVGMQELLEVAYAWNDIRDRARSIDPERTSAPWNRS